MTYWWTGRPDCPACMSEPCMCHVYEEEEMNDFEYCPECGGITKISNRIKNRSVWADDACYCGYDPEKEDEEEDN